MQFKKGAFVASVFTLLSFAANFGVFLLAYRRLAFPFLAEEQRVENAQVIVTGVLGAFAVLAILGGAAIYYTRGRSAGS